jgi:hypothetical protein
MGEEPVEFLAGELFAGHDQREQECFGAPDRGAIQVTNRSAA